MKFFIKSFLGLSIKDRPSFHFFLSFSKKFIAMPKNNIAFLSVIIATAFFYCGYFVA